MDAAVTGQEKEERMAERPQTLQVGTEVLEPGCLLGVLY